uniref:Uncharacterized protein n=1 Tax=Cannabis sativa TaxID=3483 RepID=A0A803PKI6_CANSA
MTMASTSLVNGTTMKLMGLKGQFLIWEITYRNRPVGSVLDPTRLEFAKAANSSKKQKKVAQDKRKKVVIDPAVKARDITNSIPLESLKKLKFEAVAKDKEIEVLGKAKGQTQVLGENLFPDDVKDANTAEVPEGTSKVVDNPNTPIA